VLCRGDESIEEPITRDERHDHGKKRALVRAQDEVPWSRGHDACVPVAEPARNGIRGLIRGNDGSESAKELGRAAEERHGDDWAGANSRSLRDVVRWGRRGRRDTPSRTEVRALPHPTLTPDLP